MASDALPRRCNRIDQHPEHNWYFQDVREYRYCDGLKPSPTDFNDFPCPNTRPHQEHEWENNKHCMGEPSDPIKPQHYDTIAGVECWQIARVFGFNLGNTIKYIWRAGKKDDIIQDLRKAIQFIEMEIRAIEMERENAVS